MLEKALPEVTWKYIVFKKINNEAQGLIQNRTT